MDEVEQVRTVLGLDRSNFFLYGQSWGGLLALEYALAHQQNLKGLIVSNMPMQGPSELGASGKLEHWDRSADLPRIHVPTLVIGAEHDTMDPAHLESMAHQLPDGPTQLKPGSHVGSQRLEQPRVRFE